MTITHTPGPNGDVVTLDGGPPVQQVPAPATASSPGVKNNIAYDASFLYICVATNTWMRTAIATW